jgi:hypothetical protein
MKYFISFMLMPILLSAQLMEDIFEEGKFIYMPVEPNYWEDRIMDNFSYIYKYAKYQLKASEKLKAEGASTLIYYYHKGQADAYKDLLKFMDTLPED